LAVIVAGWDGQFTILLRQRISRHIESCPDCDYERSRLVNPRALLGASPVFVPAPDWLRENTLTQVRLKPVGTSGTGGAAAHAVGHVTDGDRPSWTVARCSRRRSRDSSGRDSRLACPTRRAGPSGPGSQYRAHDLDIGAADHSRTRVECPDTGAEYRDTGAEYVDAALGGSGRDE
jgi:hypothetical protein